MAPTPAAPPMMAPTKYGPTDIKQSVLELIGNTPLLALDRIWPGPGRILVKCEFLNPAGSIKDRSAYSMIANAKADGRLKPGAPIIEVTSGNQGCGLAMVAAVLGHPVTLAMSAGNSPQRAEMMEGLGARCDRIPQVAGVPGSVTQADKEVVKQHALALIDQYEKTKAPGKPMPFFVRQFDNVDNCAAHEHHTGPEIFRQTGGRVDGFIATLGTAGSFVGISRYLKSRNPSVHCVVVEPLGAEIVAGKTVTKPCHLLQGGGYGKVPDLFDYSLMDEAMAVSDEEALKYRRELGAKEGLYVGYTSAANVAAAVRLLRSGKLPPDAWVVTLLNDTGLKYSELYK